MQRFSEVFRDFQRFSEVFRGFQRFAETFRGFEARRKKPPGGFCCGRSFGGMFFPTLLAFLALSGDVVGSFSARFLAKGSQVVYPNPIM